MVDEHVANPGLRTICIREFLKSLKQSAKLLIEDKIKALDVGHMFDVQKDKIIAPGDGLILFDGMQDQNAESIKSLEGFDRCWVEEAQTLSERSLSLLRPTIRKPDSELWFSWNPTRKSDAVDKFFRSGAVPGSIQVKANWRDNPWFPDVLEDERKLEFERYPDRYEHIWEGDYAKAFEGAYFARELTKCKNDKRICVVSADPLLPVRAFCDIGGSGANADAFAIWIVQFVGQEIRVLDYYEAVGQTLAYHAQWLRDHDWGKAIIVLPHDGIKENDVTGKRYADHFREAEFDVEEPVKNQGKGAAAMRIEAVRRIFPKCWFNAATTEAGRDALGYYHERKDELRNIGLGPEHDWSSHAADAFGLMAIRYEEPGRRRSFNRKIVYPNMGYV